MNNVVLMLILSFARDITHNISKTLLPNQPNPKKLREVSLCFFYFCLVSFKSKFFSYDLRMCRCFSFTESKNWCYRSAFARSGLQSTVTDLQDGTHMHCWVPKHPNHSKPNLLLIHGLGANAMWQWGHLVPHLTPHFNLYIPDLVFFGDSHTTRPDRTESFQAECVFRVMEAQSVRKLSLVGLSYGGFVGYSLAAQYGDFVEKVVICGGGVSMEEKDLSEGNFFRVSDLEEATKILVPQTPQMLKKLMGFTFFRPLLLGLLPSFFLSDFIHDALDNVRTKVRFTYVRRGKSATAQGRVHQLVSEQIVLVND
ncbi:hypothetical protein F8388_019449 [Cannabis sativa]|uniref:AB hydrolase-1 domain-containing protein n=1 Tax=Cannabis sativa TaxID=3483 RepID=A0A7J6EPM1_CANSA|nr:hypothetical protein F8388_019449 [Cannabis sativa]